jgi:hypothetical protein
MEAPAQPIAPLSLACGRPRGRADALVVLAVVGATAGGTHSSAPAASPHELTGPPAWPRNVEGLRNRLDALGLPALAAEGSSLHYHVHLDLFVNGKRVTVPAGVGIAPGDVFFSPLHTHDTTGVVHIELARVRPFTLGEFFGVWGVPLTPRCFGGHCAGALGDSRSTSTESGWRETRQP